MFIRKKWNADKTTALIQIVENIRVASTTKQKVIRHVGTAHNDDQINQLTRIAQVLKTELEHKTLAKKEQPKVSPQFAKELGQLKTIPQKTMIDISQVQEISRSVLGIHDIYGYLYDHLGFTNLFKRPYQRETSAKLLKEIVLARIACPTSKRAAIGILNDQFGIAVKLEHVYQMMDKIDETFGERIQQCALAETLKLTGGKLRVLFYDATTLYFESFTEDALKQNGYSKDMKFNQPQVLLALFVTEKGLPVGYELFPGATFEGHTLVLVLEKLKKRYLLDEVIFVADRGMLSDENIKYLEENQLKYIVGARIKNISKKLQTQILNRDNYSKIDKETEQTIASFDTVEGRKLIVSYSNERARKDRSDREKAIEKLAKKIAKSKDPKSLVNNYGYKKYIEIKGDATLHINQEKLQNESRWDGLLGVVTNLNDTEPKQVLAHYRNLWQIEECFRVNKHDLSIRPIYHWTPHRIKAHIAIAFMAFVCVRQLEYRLAIQSKKLSPEVIRKSLLQVQASVVKDKASGKFFLLPSPLKPEAKEIYRVIGIKPSGSAKEIQRGA